MPLGQVSALGLAAFMAYLLVSMFLLRALAARWADRPAGKALGALVA